ncbi:MAG: WG repeat-containing protein [Magnetococcales bacterium]|nr:WG repeat-containing protein [Magnetococcales bacterium]
MHDAYRMPLDIGALGRALITLALLLALAVQPASVTAKEKAAPATKRLRFQEHGKWGYRNAQDQVVIPARFVMAEPFSSHGVAAVVIGDRWALIDQQGKVLLRPMTSDNGPDPFQEGLARFIQDNLVGFYNPSGRVVIPARFDFAWPFFDGTSSVCKACQKVRIGEHTTVEGGVWGMIDKKGKIIVPMRYLSPGQARNMYTIYR